MGRRYERQPNTAETNAAEAAMQAARIACLDFFTNSYVAAGHPPVDEKGAFITEGFAEMDQIFLKMVKACDQAAQACNFGAQVSAQSWVSVGRNTAKALVRSGELAEQYTEETIDMTWPFSDEADDQIAACLEARALDETS